jgi:predicted nucleic-acid-binding protein
MRSVDTNVLVRLITRDDPRQATAADDFIEQGAWVSILALTEAMWVLDTVYEFGANDIATSLKMLLDHTSLALQDADVVTAALDLFRAKPSLGFSDCLMLHISKKAGHLPLGTFDRGLARVEGAKRI